MLYYILKPFVNVFLRVYYKLDYSGIENIPFGKPVILAPNHVNAFIDPVIIAMLPSHKIRFFARGDVFKGKIAKALLNNLNISPMYRIQEGYSELKKNDKTFEECKQLLSEDKTILLFPEGLCVQEKRLRPLKKGMARIAFQTAQSLHFSKDIYIVPVGLNYEEAHKFRSKIFIHFGTPVSISDYTSRFKEDAVRTINDFTKYFEQQLKHHLVIVNNPENDVFVDKLIELFVKDWIVKTGKNGSKLKNNYEASKEIAALVNYFDVEDKVALKKLKDLVAEYFKLLTHHGVYDHLLDPEKISKTNFGTFLIEFIKLYLGFPIYILGLLTNYPPYLIAKKISDAKIKEIEFYASFYANLGMILWLSYYLVQLLIIALLFKNEPLLVIQAILIPLLGVYVLKFYPMMKKISGRWRLLRLVRKKREAVQQLVDLKGEIVYQFEKLKEKNKNNIVSPQ